VLLNYCFTDSQMLQIAKWFRVAPGNIVIVDYYCFACSPFCSGFVWCFQCAWLAFIDVLWVCFFVKHAALAVFCICIFRFSFKFLLEDTYWRACILCIFNVFFSHLSVRHMLILCRNGSTVERAAQLSSLSIISSVRERSGSAVAVVIILNYFSGVIYAQAAVRSAGVGLVAIACIGQAASYHHLHAVC